MSDAFAGDALHSVSGVGRGGGRCRRGSVYPGRMAPASLLAPTPEPVDDYGHDGEALRSHRWPSHSGRSSVFGSPVPPAESPEGPEADAEEDLGRAVQDDDTGTYILLHSSAEDVRRPPRPATPPARDVPRPTASKRGHRRRSSVVVPTPEVEYLDTDVLADGDASPQTLPPPPGSFPDTPPSSPVPTPASPSPRSSM